MPNEEWSVAEAIAVMQSHTQHKGCMFEKLIATLEKRDEEARDCQIRAEKAETALRRIAKIAGDFEPHGFY